MASTNKTSKGLSQFLGTDRLQRDDYNNDMKKINEELDGLDQNKEPKFTKKGGFNLGISHLINSTSKILVASAYAVKLAYDKGMEALGLTVINKNQIQNNQEQIESLLTETAVLSISKTLVIGDNSIVDLSSFLTSQTKLTVEFDLNDSATNNVATILISQLLRGGEPIIAQWNSILTNKFSFSLKLSGNVLIAKKNSSSDVLLINRVTLHY